MLDKIDTKTKFKGGIMETDFDLEIVSMKPYVEFILTVNGEPTPPAKFMFQLDIRTHISVIKTLSTFISRFIEIKRLGIELEIRLLQMPYHYLNSPIKLATNTFDIHNSRIPLKKRP